MSDDAEASARAELPAEWARLESAVELALAALDEWRARAASAEAEVALLRRTMEQQLEELPVGTPDARDQIRRLKAENAVLRSRIGQAHRRISAMLAWTDMLEAAP